ncbi:polysaccharide pyruvyl transferase family protein [uncultured Bacteroides sp.]|uniref:polysaccharide pyruvyl transferase family protein n=2 Tax=Bacteroides TaxID=816 RepID=UPI0027DE2B67|nr:polysaccharide pyruvyl transferase family protein [uncultured Bacteroides sp.]
MTFSEKASFLRNSIVNALTPLISDSYVLWDLPYYTNIGDILIWEGTECFLKDLSAQCISKCAYQTFTYRPLPKNTTILLQGGGNFGDLWRMHQEFRLKVIELYPDNKIIILPQSIYYQDTGILESDAYLMSRHSNLTICVRDTQSLEILNSYFFKNNLLLLPDMAFCISQQILKKYNCNSTSKILFLKRNDIELCEKDYESYVVEDKNIVDVKDWPTMEADFFQFKILGKLVRFHQYSMADIFASNYLKPYLVKKGIRFLNNYDKVYTTRLHVAILSILLGKTFVFFDNSYGKNKFFYETWLKDIDDANFVD